MSSLIFQGYYACAHTVNVNRENHKILADTRVQKYKGAAHYQMMVNEIFKWIPHALRDDSVPILILSVVFLCILVGGIMLFCVAYIRNVIQRLCCGGADHYEEFEESP